MDESISVGAGLADVERRIAAACGRAGRPRNAVRLLAVSKTQPMEAVREALEAGQRLFGENYVQEAVEKARLLSTVEWHLIGSLQTNKVKQICGLDAPKFALIHSVDRFKLAVEIDRASDAVQDILLQVHVGDEATKHGVTLDDGGALIEQILALKNLRLRGVMSLPPLSADESTARGYFSSIREASLRWKSLLPPQKRESFNELSLGTSSDFEWAILEGATLVRVGTAIFGHRAARGRV